VSGAPRKIEGMKSTNVCVIAMETINTIRKTGSRKYAVEKEMETSAAPTRFMCIPGTRPVNVPAIIPNKRKRRISKSMKEHKL
jgi:hypothetical protein